MLTRVNLLQTMKQTQIWPCMNSNNYVVSSVAERSMLMTHGSMERNNVYLCAKYLLQIQHLDVKLLKVAIKK